MFKADGITWMTRRLLQSIVSLWVVVSMTFFLLRSLPGGPFDGDLNLPIAVKKSVEQHYGLTGSLGDQYQAYLGDLLRGRMGVSFRYEGRSVSEILMEAWPVSLLLGGLSFVFAFLLGVPLGLLAASRVGGWWDRGILLLSAGGVSIPSFLLAPVLIYLLSFGWPWESLWPSMHQYLEVRDVWLPSALWGTPRHWVLPVLTLSLRPAAFIARLTRSSMLDFINEDFSRTARAKGLSEWRILGLHVLRNACMPLLTYAGPLAAGVLSGSFVVEVIFALPGLARYFVNGVFHRDYPLVMALTIVFASLVILTQFVVDLLYRWVDPRVRGNS